MTRYRIWWRYSHNEWQQAPGFYLTPEHAQRTAEEFQRVQPMDTFLVLPDGEQPPPDEPFRLGPPEIVVL